MIPQGVEIRSELQVNQVLAFGFSGARVADATFVNLLGGELLDYIMTVAAKSPTPSAVIVDLRNVEYLSAAGMGRLFSLQRRLHRVHWQLVLLIEDPVLREV